MNKAMIEFYNGKNIWISEAVKRGLKQRLTEAQTLEGMEKVYDRIQAGEKIKDISLIWQAWEEARRSQGKEYLQWCLSRDEYMAQIDGLKRSVTIRDSMIYSLITLFLSAAILNYWIYHV